MPSTNGHGPKRAILYARVSTDEQARSGYSLAQQLEALREYAAREGYEVLEEVVDPGQSGASLERPGMDRVRDLVAAGRISVVLAQDRDRIAREPAYHYLLRREFEEHGTKIRALNDRGDDSPEGERTDGILDQLAKYERARIAERTRRGMMRKAREGRVVVTRPAYGCRYNEARDALVVCEPEMAVVEKVLRLAADGLGQNAIQTRLFREGVPSPTGKPQWDWRMIKKIVYNDAYRPHTFEEISVLLAPEVAATLDPDKEYGVQWYNRQRVTERTVSEPDGSGGRRYRKTRTFTWRPREEWVAARPRPCSALARGSGTERDGRQVGAREEVSEPPVGATGPHALPVREEDADAHDSVEERLSLLLLFVDPRWEARLCLQAEVSQGGEGRGHGLGFRLRDAETSGAHTCRHGPAHSPGGGR
jgi:site-specific DNA recombinase